MFHVPLIPLLPLCLLGFSDLLIVLRMPIPLISFSNSSYRSFICLPKLHAPLRIVRFLLPIVPCLFLPAPPALCQDSASEGTVFRGDKAEISVTVRESSGEPISAPPSGKVNKKGMPPDRKKAAPGRESFI